MYFKKLEMFGFKSFADRTVLNFEPGITAVVGPNGCGKSNVFDAIRWALGEQSAKQLRGGAMEDVIFNGTDTKLALGFAEVSVTFDNASRMLSTNADEVMITRRLFRSGESEYLINKEVVRLRDVAELFMDTGVGAEAYSLIQQGKVDLVVSAKPDDRRMIFDEAAGITKYKAKKREAQSKLKETDDNLLRINDIVVEVKRQISSIERQAQKAQKYKAEFEKLKGLEQILALYQLDQYSREKRELQGFLDGVKGKEDSSTQEIEDFRQVVERESVLLEDLEAKIREAREEDLRIDGQIELHNRQIGFNEERINNLRENEVRANEQKTQLLEKCRVHQEKIGELERMLAEFEKDLQASLAALEDRKAALERTSRLISEYQDSVKNDEENILRMTSSQVDMKNRQTEIMKETQGHIARRHRLESENVKVLAEKEQVERRLQGISSGMSEIAVRRESLLADIAREKGILAGQNEDLLGLARRIEGLEHRKLFLVSQKDFIEKLQVQYQDIPDPVITGRFLSSVNPSEKQSGIIGKVKNVAPIDPARYESLKQYLADLEGESLYEVVCETKFVELDLQSLASQIDRIEEGLQGLRAEKEARENQVGEQARLIERIQADVHAEERRLSVFEAQQTDVGVEAQKIYDELQTIALERREADESLVRLRQDEETLANELKNTEAEIAFLREGIKGREGAILDKRREREEAAVAVAKMEAEIHSMRERETSWQENLAMFRNDMNGHLGESSRLDHEIASFNARREQFIREIDQLRQTIEELRVSREQGKETLARYQAEEQDVSQRLNSVRTQIVMMEKEIADDREFIHARAMKVQQIDFQEQAVRERMSQRYNIDLTQVPPAGSLPLAVEGEPQPQSEAGLEPQIDIGALQEEIQTLSRRCDSFGAVNLVAIDEFEDLKGRFQFLTKQQSDLLTAKDSLEQTIRKINKTTRQLFTDTFIKVNDQFRVYFRMLFGGGEAQLVLLDPDNALESGIDIIARPPGKKRQNISLFSGGEKTMTAIALIFAVFRVNPSPFCVLDEIDAALDESNVDRFAAVLKEFAKIAQFIIITHNKKTIAHANVMYGVTMQQTGVSRMVSVKLSDSPDQETIPARAASRDPAADEQKSHSAPAEGGASTAPAGPAAEEKREADDLVTV